MANPNGDVHWDLTSKMAPYFDSHLLMPLLLFLRENKIYPEEEVETVKSRLLSTAKSNNAPKSHDNPEGDPPGKLENVRPENHPENDVVNAIVQTDNAGSTLQTTFASINVSNASEYSKFFKLAKSVYERGNYVNSLEILNQLTHYSNDQNQLMMVFWGRLSCNILLENWENACENLLKLKDLIEHQHENFLLQIQQRTWLVHYALFIYAHLAEYRLQYLDWFLHERYMFVLQTICPYIRRYLVVSFVIRKRRNQKDIQKLLEPEMTQYSDPILKFWEALYVNYDFDLTQKMLSECHLVFDHDYFLKNSKNEFFEHAKDLMLEMFCSIYNRIDINVLNEKLNKSAEDSVKWIMNMCHNSKLGCKVDHEKNQVTIDLQTPSIYQQIIEKSQSLCSRSFFASLNE